MENKKSSKLGTASLVLGIIGFVLSCIVIGIIPCIIGAILAIVALTKKDEKHGTAVSGLIICIIGIFMFIIMFIVIGSASDDIKETEFIESAEEEDDNEVVEETKEETKEETTESSKSETKTEDKKEKKSESDKHKENKDDKEKNSKKQEKSYVESSEIEQVYADPDEYDGKYIKIGGIVFGEPEIHEDKTYFQMYADTSYSKNTYICYNGKLDIKADDYVMVDGIIDGNINYKNVFGGKLSALSINADTVNSSNYIECFAPTINEISVNKSIDQNGYVVTLDKVEFAENETRLYMTISNNGQSVFTVYDSSITIVQGSAQYEYEYNFEADYESLQSDLRPGAISSGIVLFPKIDDKQSFTVYCDSYCEDWNLDFEEYVFEVNPN